MDRTQDTGHRTPINRWLPDLMWAMFCDLDTPHVCHPARSCDATDPCEAPHYCFICHRNYGITQELQALRKTKVYWTKKTELRKIHKEAHLSEEDHDEEVDPQHDEQEKAGHYAALDKHDAVQSIRQQHLHDIPSGDHRRCKLGPYVYMVCHRARLDAQFGPGCPWLHRNPHVHVMLHERTKRED